jgi:hypothetical protein
LSETYFYLESIFRHRKRSVTMNSGAPRGRVAQLDRASAF